MGRDAGIRITVCRPSSWALKTQVPVGIDFMREVFQSGFSMEGWYSLDVHAGDFVDTPIEQESLVDRAEESVKLGKVVSIAVFQVHEAWGGHFIFNDQSEITFDPTLSPPMLANGVVDFSRILSAICVPMRDLRIERIECWHESP
jgi:hypothetical protein